MTDCLSVVAVEPKAKPAARSGDEKVEDRLADAYHEAGHAVIARILSLPCGGVTVDRTRRVLCGVSVPDPWLILDVWEDRKKFRGEQSAMLGRILAYMAGHEAELAYVGAFRGWDDGDDFEIAAMLDTMRICGRSPRGPRDDMARYAGRLRHWTRRLVRRHSRKIHRLASELMRRRSLTPGEIDAILAKL